MALVKFNTLNINTQRKGVPTIRINRKSAIFINSVLVKLMELKDGDKVGFYQDDEDPFDWYITKDEDGFALRDDGKGGGMSFNSTAFANLMLDSHQLEGKSYKFKVAKEPLEASDGELIWCIIMASATE